jgi:hypothetical protein
MRKRVRLRASTIATITAVAAITLGIIDSVQTRAHNRLSVSPYIVVDYSIAAQTDQSVFRVNLSNEGVGPAIIKSVRITLPDSLGGRSHESWNDVAALLRERGAEVPTYWNYEGGEAVGVQGSRELIRINVPAAIAPTLLPLLTDMNVEITYASIYREDFRASLKQ